jgi:hypothetical protein
VLVEASIRKVIFSFAIVKWGLVHPKNGKKNLTSGIIGHFTPLAVFVDQPFHS